MNYFWGDVGLNADIERHRKEEKRLCEMIAKLEAIESPSEFQERSLNVYRSILCKLLQSKAEVASKIGKK